MKARRFFWFMSLVLLVAVVAWSSGDAFAKKAVTVDDVAKKLGKVTPSEQKAAAKRARAQGLRPGVAGKRATTPELQPGVAALDARAPQLGPVAGITASPYPSRELKGLAGFRIISAPTLTGLSARCPRAPSLWSMLWTEAPAIPLPW